MSKLCITKTRAATSLPEQLFAVGCPGLKRNLNKLYYTIRGQGTLSSLFIKLVAKNIIQCLKFLMIDFYL